MTHPREDPVQMLRRWESAGGQWRVLARSDVSVVVGLFSCDAGEEMHRLTASCAELEVLLTGSGPSAPAAAHS